jgi:hypothetical protein
MRRIGRDPEGARNGQFCIFHPYMVRRKDLFNTFAKIPSSPLCKRWPAIVLAYDRESLPYTVLTLG